MALLQDPVFYLFAVPAAILIDLLIAGDPYGTREVARFV